jgi:hypothetical protein
MDSDAAARGLAALRAVAGPGRDLELAAAMHAAFYRDGKSLSEVSTYADIAVGHGLDAQDVVAHLSDPQVAGSPVASRTNSPRPAPTATRYCSCGEATGSCRSAAPPPRRRSCERIDAA